MMAATFPNRAPFRTISSIIPVSADKSLRIFANRLPCCAVHAGHNPVALTVGTRTRSDASLGLRHRQDVKGLQNCAVLAKGRSPATMDSSCHPLTSPNRNTQMESQATGHKSEFQQLVDNALQLGHITYAEANALLQLTQAVQFPQELRELLNVILGEGVNALPAANSTLSEVPAAIPTPGSFITNSTLPSPLKRLHEDVLQVLTPRTSEVSRTILSILPHCQG